MVKAQPCALRTFEKYPFSIAEESIQDFSGFLQVWFKFTNLSGEAHTFAAHDLSCRRSAHALPRRSYRCHYRLLFEDGSLDSIIMA